MMRALRIHFYRRAVCRIAQQDLLQYTRAADEIFLLDFKAHPDRGKCLETRPKKLQLLVSLTRDQRPMERQI